MFFDSGVTVRDRTSGVKKPLDSINGSSKVTTASTNYHLPVDYSIKVSEKRGYSTYSESLLNNVVYSTVVVKTVNEYNTLPAEIGVTVKESVAFTNKPTAYLKNQSVTTVAKGTFTAFYVSTWSRRYGSCSFAANIKNSEVTTNVKTVERNGLVTMGEAVVTAKKTTNKYSYAIPSSYASNKTLGFVKGSDVFTYSSFYVTAPVPIENITTYTSEPVTIINAIYGGSNNGTATGVTTVKFWS